MTVPQIKKRDLDKLAAALDKEAASVRGDADLGCVGPSYLVIPYEPTPRELTDHNCIQAGAIAFWGGWRARAEARVFELEKQFEMWFAECYEAVREKLAKNASETAAKNKIRSTYKDEIRKREMEIIAAQRDAEFLKAVFKAWEQKGVLLATMTKAAVEEQRQTGFAGVRGAPEIPDEPPEVEVSEEVPEEEAAVPVEPVASAEDRPRKKKKKKKKRFLSAGIP